MQQVCSLGRSSWLLQGTGLFPTVWLATTCRLHPLFLLLAMGQVQVLKQTDCLPCVQLFRPSTSLSSLRLQTLHGSSDCPSHLPADHRHRHATHHLQPLFHLLYLLQYISHRRQCPLQAHAAIHNRVMAIHTLRTVQVSRDHTPLTPGNSMASKTMARQKRTHHGEETGNHAGMYDFATCRHFRINVIVQLAPEAVLQCLPHNL